MPPQNRTASAYAQPHAFGLPHTAYETTLGILRLAFAWIFLWAFLDKTFGLGYATTRANAWVNGGSPTFGFLNFGAAGPFQGFYNSIAGNVIVDWLFMVGLLGIGLAFLLGIGMRIGAVAGALMLVLMWTAALPPANNPFLDDHLVYAIAMIALALAGAGRYLGFGAAWQSMPYVRKNRWLE